MAGQLLCMVWLRGARLQYGLLLMLGGEDMIRREIYLCTDKTTQTVSNENDWTI